jgi:hypothetical protein
MHTIQRTDLAAVWARCRIQVKGDSLEPVAPFTAYNPFDFYFPAGQAPQREQRSLYFEFLRTDASKPESIVDFCERFGVLHVLDDGKSLSIVDSYPMDADPKELAKNPPWSLGAALLARYGDMPLPPGGYRALKVDDFRQAQADLRRALTWAQAWQAASSRDEAAKARFNLRRLVNSKLQFAYSRLVWDAQQARWVTGWDIRSLESAMYHMLLFDLQGQGRIQTCPWCESVFLADRERTRFCSLRCQNAHSASQFREKALKATAKRVAHSSHGGPPKRKPKGKTKR